MSSLLQAPCSHQMRPEYCDGVHTPPREGAARGTISLCRTGIFSLRFRLPSCRITPRHAHCIDAMRKERSVDSRSKATKVFSDFGSGILPSVSFGCSVRHTGNIEESKKEGGRRHV